MNDESDVEADDEIVDGTVDDGTAKVDVVVVDDVDAAALVIAVDVDDGMIVTSSLGCCLVTVVEA